MRTPSRVSAGPCGAGSGAGTLRGCRGARSASATSADGSMMSSPAVPSTTTGMPGLHVRVASPRPTTVGMPSERARIAVCEVRLPASMARPVTRDQSTWAATDGGGSSATSTKGPSPCDEQVLPAARSVAQVHADAAGDIGDVAAPIAQVRVVDVVEQRRDLVERPLHRPLRVHLLLADQRPRAADEQRVVEHQQLRVEQRRQLGARPGAQLAANGRDLLPRSLPRALEPRHLVVDPRVGHRHAQRASAAHEQHGLTRGDAADDART